MFPSLLLAASLSFSTYTNHAGQVVRACPLAVTNGVVTVALDGGRRASYPLSIFPASEQRRIKASLGVADPPPPAPRPPRNRLRETFDRRRRALEEMKSARE